MTNSKSSRTNGQQVEDINIRCDAIIREVLEGTGATYGYIGNCSPARDDRSWRITLPHSDRPGNASDIIGHCEPTESRRRLLVFATAFRQGFDLAQKLASEVQQ